MNAYKCDVCGKYYNLEKYNVYFATNEKNKLGKYRIGSTIGNKELHKLNLCDECYLNLEEICCKNR